ncbi:uncharacterized protein GIQ15_02464 [Arthroderma uncinatum]|uniref:uncharacterized protein n=1 Tax=Arthroderma uncinatum TaxID=74035 RepID=UPI00144AB3A6|nr:uncharacterized protein GIQ15_02464 [Arthroderma uncinatum]KAF3483140.1 hypothetical protein GIQ15_02464 [Arthroderma uncinatum]
MAISNSYPVLIAANVFATMCVRFGINAILRPDHGVSFFELSPPTSGPERTLFNSLMAVYGVRDVFMGLAIYATACLGERKALGWILLGVSGVAFADGVVCAVNGAGEWNHWTYAPVVMAVGVAALGVLDGGKGKRA